MRQNLMDFVMGSVGALLLSASARALPAPGLSGSRFYAWFYQFAHLVLANFDKARFGNDNQSGGR